MSKKLEDGGRQRAREKVGRARSHGAPTGIELQGSVLCTHVREVWAPYTFVTSYGLTVISAFLITNLAFFASRT